MTFILHQQNQKSRGKLEITSVKLTYRGVSFDYSYFNSNKALAFEKEICYNLKR